jgi:hypothetical protein
MSRVLVRLAFAPGAPRCALSTPLGERRAPFGTWLRERVASLALDWPAIAIHQQHHSPVGVELVLLPGRGLPPLVSGRALARAAERELSVAARRGGWVKGELFCGVEVVVEDGTRDKGQGTSDK